jgi:hypothetical protein
MVRKKVVRLAAVAPAALLCTFGGQDRVLPPLSIGGAPGGGVQGAATRATPGAYGDCGPDGIPETGLQGQVPKDDQDSGRSKRGSRCNLRLVGENDIQGRGANFQMGWYRSCAYVGSVGARDYQTSTGDELDGVAVIDAKDPRRPELVRIVRAPDGVSQHEAVEVNERRGMLVVQTGGLSARYVDVYDVSGDCRNPVYKGRYDGGGPIFHGQRISPDGNTVYATDYTGYAAASGGVMHVIDVSDMSNPRLITKWDPTQEAGSSSYGIHDLEVSADGRRLYLGAVDPSATRGALIAGPPSNTGPTMVVLDTSEVQDRKPDPDLKVVSDVRLPNFGHTEQRATINGRPYLITSGETPFVGADNCPWAWGNIVDMSDERNPRPVSEIKLAVNEQANCGTVGEDDAVYSIHYIGVDDVENTTTVFYTYYTGGVRVFDVRDPTRPQEVAYYHPPPVETTAHPPLPKNAGDYQGPEWDSATSDIRYFPEERRLWFVSIGRGFQVLELTTPGARRTVPRGSATIRRQTRRAVLRRGSVRVRARCSTPCRMDLRVQVSGRRGGPRRTLAIGASGRREVRLPLGRAARRWLRRHPRARVRVVAGVREAGTGRLLRRFRTPLRRL